MQITKCDICRKKIKDEKIKLWVHGERFMIFELCEKCSQPIMKLLKNKGLIKDKKVNKD
jgi:hypothetical protein